jgi:hypothetical protein
VPVSGIDLMEVHKQNLKIVQGWQPLTDPEQAKLLERVEPFAGDGHLEHYETR